MDLPQTTLNERLRTCLVDNFSLFTCHIESTSTNYRIIKCGFITNAFHNSRVKL
jgi:hypothetical protein